MLPDYFDEFEDTEMMGHQHEFIGGLDWVTSDGYYTGIDYSKFQEHWDDTLDWITMLPEKGDEQC
jgi:hypothetical protein